MAESILVRNTRDPLAGLTVQEFERRLVLALKDRVEGAWFFGSYARDRLGPDSDVDLILVVETRESFTNRPWRFADLLDIGPRLDLLVYTPEEFHKLVAQPTAGFWRNVVETLRQLV